MTDVTMMTNAEIAACIETAKLAPAKYLEFTDLGFHKEAIAEAAKRLRGCACRDEDLRLAYHYLSLHRRMLENSRLGYLRRYEDSGCELDNERAKANHVQVDINTIDGWLERFREYAIEEGRVTHLNPDYSFKKTISFREEDLENGKRGA